MDNEIELSPNTAPNTLGKSIGALSIALATYSLMRKGNYNTALSLYRHGGGGFNVYKQQENGRRQRVFAIDYHSFWDGKQNVNKLHYHRGENSSQMKKHRPYQGGW